MVPEPVRDPGTTPRASGMPENAGVLIGVRPAMWATPGIAVDVRNDPPGDYRCDPEDYPGEHGYGPAGPVRLEKRDKDVKRWMNGRLKTC